VGGQFKCLGVLSTPDPAIPFQLGGYSDANLALGAGIGFRNRTKIATLNAIYDLHKAAAGDSYRIEGLSWVLFGRGIERDKALGSVA